MEKCVFCRIADRTVSSKVVKENNDFIAIVPKEIEVDGHLIVFPKCHYESMQDIDPEVLKELTHFVQEICKWLKRNYGYLGFNILHASGEAAQQSIFHFHYHILPRKSKSEFNAWPTLPGGVDVY